MKYEKMEEKRKKKMLEALGGNSSFPESLK